jgi:hypothetical protein
VAEKRVQKVDGSVGITTADAVDRSRLTVDSLNEPARACRRALIWWRTHADKNEPAWISDPRPAHLEGIQD